MSSEETDIKNEIRVLKEGIAAIETQLTAANLAAEEATKVLEAGLHKAADAKTLIGLMRFQILKLEERLKVKLQ